jgi:hypothetical protein
MSLDTILRLAVAVSAIYCLAALVFLVARTFVFGKRQLFAKPQGDPIGGIVYAFGRGMLPWEKESASKHLPTFFAGIFYHLGIFGAFVILVVILLSAAMPQSLTQLLRLLCVLGLLSGLGLLAKRIAQAHMRFISNPDDYVSNVFVELLLAAALITTYSPSFSPLILSIAILLLIYIPVGKIRHCFFFFYSRMLFGRFYGRRGTLPHPSPEV